MLVLLDLIEIIILGWLILKCVVICVSRLLVRCGIVVMFNCFILNEWMLVVLVLRLVRLMNVFLIFWKNCDLFIVGWRWLVLWLNNGNWVMVLSWLISWLMWGCEVCMWCVVCVIDFVWNMVWNVLMCFKFRCLVVILILYRWVWNWNFIRLSFLIIV